MEEELGLVRISPLTAMIHKIGEENQIRAQQDAKVCLQNQIEQLAKILITQSMNNALEKKRKTIKPEDVMIAFQDLMHPNIVIDESINELKYCIDKLEIVRKKGFSIYLEV